MKREIPIHSYPYCTSLNRVKTWFCCFERLNLRPFKDNCDGFAYEKMCDFGKDLDLYSVITTSPFNSQSCLLNHTQPFLSSTIFWILDKGSCSSHDTRQHLLPYLFHRFTLEIFNTMKLCCFQGMVEHVVQQTFYAFFMNVSKSPSLLSFSRAFSF